MSLGATPAVPRRQEPSLLDLWYSCLPWLCSELTVCCFVCSPCEQCKWIRSQLTCADNNSLRVVGAAATQSGGGDLRGPDDDLVLPVSQHAATQWHSLPPAALCCLLSCCGVYSVAAVLHCPPSGYCCIALPTQWLLCCTAHPVATAALRCLLSG